LAAAAGALAVAAVAIAFAASTLALLLFLAGFGLPALVLLAFGLRGGRIRPSLPFALLGLWPAGLTLVLGLAFADQPGGLEGVMRRALEYSFAHSGLAVPEEAIEMAARLKPGMLGLVFGVAMAAN